MSIVKLPRMNLGNWPTPLHELPHLSAALGGPRIFVKRDDLTGLALGGNKCHKLEYVLGDAKQRGIDSIITTGSSQSNFAVQMVAAARKIGMDPYLVLIKGVHAEMQGNLLLANMLNAKISILDVTVTDPAEMFTIGHERMNELANELRSQGHKPLVIPAGASNCLGTAGWVDGAEEISKQLEKQEISVHYVVVANSTGGTQAGLVLGFKYLRFPMTVIGISVLNKKAEAQNTVVTQAEETAKLLGLDVAITPADVTIYDDYIGQGYGIPTKECINAIRLVAQTEAIFLDPVYTGKAMAGLIDLVNRGYYTKNDTVLFIHTGGVAADFAYNAELTK